MEIDKTVETVSFDPFLHKNYDIKVVPMDFFGKDALAFFIDDMTTHVNLEEQLKLEQEKYRAATEGANLRVYEYDIPTHRIILPEHARKLFGVDENVIHDVPDSILPQFRPEDQKRVRAFFARVNQGEKTVEDSFQMMPVNGYSTYLHYTFTTVVDAFGRAEKAYAVAEDVTAQKRAQDDFNETIHALLATNPNALCAYKINLTENLCNEEHGTSEYIQNVLRADTADKLFENLLSIIPDSAQHDNAKIFFARSTLISAFNEGRKSLHLDYMRFDADHNIIWVRTFVNMLKSPDKDDIIAVFYSLDISDEKRNQSIFDIITNQQCDYVALLYPHTEKIQYLSLNSELKKNYLGIYDHVGEMYDFDEVRKFAAQCWVAEEDKENYLNKSSLKIVEEELDRYGHYETNVLIHFNRKEEVSCRKIQHYYLDEQKNTILIIQNDVTAIYMQRQQEIISAKAEAHQVEDIFNRLPIGICVLNMPDPEHVYTSFCNMQQYKMLGIPYYGSSIKDIDKNGEKLALDYFQDEFSGIHQDDVQRMRELYRQGYGQQKFTTPNIRYKCADGTYKYITTELVRRTAQSNEHIFYAIYRDVSEEVELQNLLEKQRQEQMEKTLVSMIGNLPANYVLFREYEDGTLIPERYSDEFCRMKGCTQETIGTLNGTDGYSPIYPDDRDKVEKAVHDTRTDNLLHTTEYRIRLMNNNYKWVSVNFSHVTIGAQKYVYCVYTDIDELKKQERELEEQYNTAMAFLDSVSGSYFATQRANLSRNTVEFTGGLDPLQLKERNTDYETSMQIVIQSMPKQSDRIYYTERLSRTSLIKGFEQGERTRNLEFMITLADGSVHWVRNTITMAKRPEGDDIISFMAVRDISTEKFTNDIMMQVVSKKLDYICCISIRTGKIVLFFSGLDNPSLNDVKQGMDYNELMLAYNNQHVVADERKKCSAFMDLDHVQYSLEESEHAEGVYSFDERDGIRIAHVEFFWLDKENGLIVLTRTDITEAQRLQLEHEKALNDALNSTEQANRAKTDFLSRMSHDIRTPLNGIIGMTYLSRSETDPEKIKANLDKIDTSSKFLLGLINDVLDMSKAESGKVELHQEPYPPQEFMSYIDAVIKPLVVERNQELICENSVSDDMIPILDKLRFNQIFFNLLSNAVKYTPEGGHIRFAISGKRLPGRHMHLHAEVNDDGIGISDEFQKVIFDPFSQEGRNDTSLQRGTGLGMAITKQLVTLMGGTIRVESKIGQGSTFFVDMSMETAEADEKAKVNPLLDTQLDTCENVLSGKHILLCEDHPLNQEIAKALLAEKKMIVTTAEDGRIGYELFRDSAPYYYDAVLMDIRMPVMDGYEATRSIRNIDRADAKTVPIIAMTADAFSDDVQKCMDAGMDSHLSKPIEPEVLYQALCSAVEKKRS